MCGVGLVVWRIGVGTTTTAGIAGGGEGSVAVDLRDRVGLLSRTKFQPWAAGTVRGGSRTHGRARRCTVVATWYAGVVTVVLS